MQSHGTNEHCLNQFDYDLHGIVGIRLLNASPRDAAVVTRDLGPIQKPFTRKPDIIIRFVDHLPLSTPICYLGVDDAGFTDDAFLVLRSRHKVPTKVQIPFEKVGQQCEIVCERGLPAVPLLIPIINLTALAKGTLPLHASAFTYNGTGILVTGWAKGGKTETLLAFAAKNAKYIGDEWVYISSDGQNMYGIPEPIRLWDWHLQDMPEYWALVKPGDRVRLRVLRLLVRSMDWVGMNFLRNASASAQMIRRVTYILRWQLNVRIPPQKLFGQGFGPLVDTLEKVFFVASHEDSEVRVESVEPQEIARRMVYSLQLERMEFLSYYLKFRFAFPEVSNALVEQAEELQYKMLTKILMDKDIFAVYHPYPVSIPLLYEAISPFCS